MEGGDKTVALRAVSGGKNAQKHTEKKLIDKGLQRLDRHPAHGTGIGQPLPKSGRGGKYTWEGPDGAVSSELSPVPPAVDRRDPNYVNEEEEEEEEEEVSGLVVGKVEVAKAPEAKHGVARIDVDPKLNV